MGKKLYYSSWHIKDKIIYGEWYLHEYEYYDIKPTNFWAYCTICQDFHEGYVHKVVKETEWKRKEYRKSYYHVCEFRKDPIPYSGKFKLFHFNSYRRPKTTQELRWNEAHKKYVRPKRNKAHLVNSWDDISRGNIFNRYSWKKQKIKKQWMKHLK